jgi:hypothetical protein
MQIDEAVPRNFEQTAGNHLAIGHDDGSIGSTVSETRIDFIRLEAAGLQTLEIEGTSCLDYRWWDEDLMPPNRPVRS